MSVKIFLKKQPSGIYILSMTHIDKFDTSKVKKYNVLDSIPNFKTAMSEARKLARTWKWKESMIDLYISGCSSIRNGRYIYETGKFWKFIG